MLSDEITYKKLPRDPAPALERRMSDFLLALKNKDVLPPNLYYKIRSSAGKTSQLYGLPKIHKPGRPLRPIVSFVNSPTYQLSKLLANSYTIAIGRELIFSHKKILLNSQQPNSP